MGADVKTLALPDGTSLLEKKSHESVRQVFAELPDRSTLIIDGLAFGVLDEIAEKEISRIKKILSAVLDLCERNKNDHLTLENEPGPLLWFHVLDRLVNGNFKNLPK